MVTGNTVAAGTAASAVGTAAAAAAAAVAAAAAGSAAAVAVGGAAAGSFQDTLVLDGKKQPLCAADWVG